MTPYELQLSTPLLRPFSVPPRCIFWVTHYILSQHFKKSCSVFSESTSPSNSSRPLKLEMEAKAAFAQKGTIPHLTPSAQGLGIAAGNPCHCTSTLSLQIPLTSTLDSGGKLDYLFSCTPNVQVPHAAVRGRFVQKGP